MADYRTRSYGERHIEVVNGKEYSARQSQANSSVYAHSNSYSEPGNIHGNFESVKTSKSKSAKAWSLSDPEVKRRKRVASYKVYTVEGKMKASFFKSFRWIKDKYTEIVQGW